MSLVSSRIPTSKAIIARAHRSSLPSRDTVCSQARTGPVAGAAWNTFNAGIATLTPAIFNAASICAQNRVGVKEPGDTRAWTIEADDIREACKLLGLPPLTEDTRGGMSSTRVNQGMEEEEEEDEDESRLNAVIEKTAARAREFAAKKEASKKKKKLREEE